MRNVTTILALLMLGAPLVQSCSETKSGPPPGTTPIRQLTSQNRSPVEVVSFARDGNLVVPRFKVVLRNVCDKPVKMVSWTQLFFAADGTQDSSSRREGGIAELSGIAPGETYEGVMLVGEATARGRIIIKSVTYESVPEGAENDPSMSLYKLNFQWKNPNHDAAVRALTTDAPPGGGATRI